MDDKECIARMLDLHKKYREVFLEKLENPELRHHYFNILIDESVPNNVELYTKRRNLEFLKSVRYLENDFLNCFSDDIKKELLEIWRGGILSLLSRDVTLKSELRDFIDVEDKIMNESICIDLSESLDRKIEKLDFERKKLKYLKIQKQKEKNNGK